MPPPSSFPSATLEHVAHVLGEAHTGSTISRLLADARMEDQLGSGATKWKRLLAAFEARQRRDGNGGGVARYIVLAMSPQRFAGAGEQFEEIRAQLNGGLLFDGLSLEKDGKLHRKKAARSLSEAEERADRLRSLLRARRVHPDVLAACRPELLAQDYFHAVLEAGKSVSEKIRRLTGLTLDGAELADAAFTLKANMPPLAFNACDTPSRRSAHTGYGHFVRGVAGAFRNPTAHDPRVAYPISEEDALDMLATISMVHRRLDGATVTPAAPAHPHYHP